MAPQEEELDLGALKMSARARGGRRWRPPWRRLALMAAAVIVVVAILRLAPLPFNATKVQTAPAQVVTPTQDRTVLTATGYTYARQRAAVGAKIIGRVVKLGVEEGDRVARGDLIAVLDSADLKAQVAAAQGRLDQAQATLDDAQREEKRQNALLAKDLTPQATYDSALARLDESRAKVASARADVEVAQAQAAYAVINAPIDGIVVERNIEVGEMVAPGGFTSQQSTGAIVRIADLSSLEVEADINESYIARVEIGQPVVINVDAVPNHPYHGKLRQVVPTADRQRGTVQVKVTLEDRDEHLVPDMSCAVRFLEPGTTEASLAGPSRILVPQAAVLTGAGRPAVFVVQDGRLHRTDVSLGPKEDGQIEIRAGLKGGETVVAQATTRLKDGERVRAVGP